MYGRSWVRFPSGTQIFSLSHAHDKLDIKSLLTEENLVRFLHRGKPNTRMFVVSECHTIEYSAKKKKNSELPLKMGPV